MARGRRATGARGGVRHAGKRRDRCWRRWGSRCSAEGAPGAHQSRDRRDGDPRGGGLAWTGEADTRTALGTGAWNPTTPCPRGTGSMGLGLCVGAARRGGQPSRFPPPGAPAQVRPGGEPAHQAAWRHRVAKGVCRLRFCLDAPREDTARQRTPVGERRRQCPPVQHKSPEDRAAGLSDA